jgi:hypothetical protein
MVERSHQRGGRTLPFRIARAAPLCRLPIRFERRIHQDSGKRSASFIRQLSHGTNEGLVALEMGQQSEGA